MFCLSSSVSWLGKYCSKINTCPGTVHTLLKYGLLTGLKVGIKCVTKYLRHYACSDWLGCRAGWEYIKHWHVHHFPGFPSWIIFKTSISTDGDCCAFHPKGFTSFPRKPFQKLFTVPSNKLLLCVIEVPSVYFTLHLLCALMLMQPGLCVHLVPLQLQSHTLAQPCPTTTATIPILVQCTQEKNTQQGVTYRLPTSPVWRMCCLCLFLCAWRQITKDTEYINILIDTVGLGRVISLINVIRASNIPQFGSNTLFSGTSLSFVKVELRILLLCIYISTWWNMVNLQ